MSAQTVPCIACGEALPLHAARCPNCNARQSDVDPATARLSSPVYVTALAMAVGRIHVMATGLRRAAVFLEVVAILSAIGGVIVGIGLAIYPVHEHVPAILSGDPSSITTHPFIAAGAGLAVGAVIAAVLYFAIARALSLFAEYVAVAVEMPLVSDPSSRGI
jgi:hypothetical protein